MPHLTISARAGIDNNKLSVAYTVRNDTEENVYLFVVLWDFDNKGKAVLDSFPAYVSIDDRRVLQLGKIVYPHPKHQFVELRVVPFARLLPAGKEWQDRMVFELPINEYSPYYIATADSLWDEVSAKALRVCVSYIASLDGLESHETPIEGALRLEHPDLLKRIKVVSSGDIALEAAVLRRADEFERFSC